MNKTVKRMTITSILVDSLAMPSEARQHEVRKVPGCRGGGTTGRGRPRGVGSWRLVWWPEQADPRPPWAPTFTQPVASPSCHTNDFGHKISGKLSHGRRTNAEPSLGANCSTEDSVEPQLRAPGLGTCGGWQLALIRAHAYRCKAESPSGHRTKGKQSSPEFFSCRDKMWDE